MAGRIPMSDAEARKYVTASQIREARLTPQDARIATSDPEHIPVIPDDWSITFTLPWPPTSTNNAYHNVPKKGRVLTKEARAWKVQAKSSIQAQLGRRAWLEYRRTDLATRLFACEVWECHPQPLTYDVDNYSKLLLDCMQECGLYVNDNRVFKLVLEKRPVDTHAIPCLEVRLSLWQGPSRS